MLQTLRANFRMYEIRMSDIYDVAYRFRKKIRDPRLSRVVSFPSFRPRLRSRSLYTRRLITAINSGRFCTNTSTHTRRMHKFCSAHTRARVPRGRPRLNRFPVAFNGRFRVYSRARFAEFGGTDKLYEINGSLIVSFLSLSLVLSRIRCARQNRRKPVVTFSSSNSIYQGSYQCLKIILIPRD